MIKGNSEIIKKAENKKIIVIENIESEKDERDANSWATKVGIRTKSGRLLDHCKIAYDS